MRRGEGEAGDVATGPILGARENVGGARRLPSA